MANLRRNAPLYLLLALIAGLYLANSWAARANAARDAGITWLDATSGRSGQTYVIRATLDGDRLLHFALEAERYRFASCHLEPAGELAGCTDHAGGRWTIER